MPLPIGPGGEPPQLPQPQPLSYYERWLLDLVNPYDTENSEFLTSDAVGIRIYLLRNLARDGELINARVMETPEWQNDRDRIAAEVGRIWSQDNQGRWRAIIPEIEGEGFAHDNRNN